MNNSERFFANKDCKYYPCHKLEGDFNCLFCYCPLYHIKDCPGNHSYKEIKGKMVKVCSNCTFPHEPGNYEIVKEILKRN